MFVAPLLQKHLDATLELIRRAPQVRLLEVDYAALVRDPAPVIAQLIEFLGEGSLPSSEKMSAVVDPRLHRQRS